jgi:hypothetical protein
MLIFIINLPPESQQEVIVTGSTDWFYFDINTKMRSMIPAVLVRGNDSLVSADE